MTISTVIQVLVLLSSNTRVLVNFKVDRVRIKVLVTASQGLNILPLGHQNKLGT